MRGNVCVVRGIVELIQNGTSRGYRGPLREAHVPTFREFTVNIPSTSIVPIGYGLEY